MSIYVVVGIVIIVIAVLLREADIMLKRPQRMRELRHLISMITDPAGCERAQVMRYYESCKHIIEHYGIELEELGKLVTCDGCIVVDLADLYAEVEKSARRAKSRSDLCGVCVEQAPPIVSSHFVKPFDC